MVNKDFRTSVAPAVVVLVAPEQVAQRQSGGSTDSTRLEMRDLRLVPWCLIDLFQSLAVPRPLACWNWFGVIHDPVRHTDQCVVAACWRFGAAVASIDARTTLVVIDGRFWTIFISLYTHATPR